MAHQDVPNDEAAASISLERSSTAAGPPPGIRDRYFRRTRTTHLIYRAVVGVVGAAVIVVGIILLPLPGPGWLIIFAGLAILASEFTWAQRLLEFARVRVMAWTHWAVRQPLWVRLLIGLGCVVIVALAVLAYLIVFGVPSWLPGGPTTGLESWVQSVVP